MLKIVFLIALLWSIHHLNAPWWVYLIALGSGLEFTVGGERIL